jgi:integrase
MRRSGSTTGLQASSPSLAEQFLADYAPPRLKDLEEYRRQATSILRRHVLPALGEMPVMSVRRRDVEAMRDRVLRAGRSKQTAVHVMNLASRLLKWAVGQELVGPVDPFAGVDRPSLAHTESVDFLDAAEVPRLLAHAEEHGPPLVYSMIGTCIYAGLRRGELAGLRWRDIDFAAGRLTVARSYRRLPKGGKIRHLGLHPELARVLRQWRERCPETPEGLVFPIPGKGGYRMLNRAELLGLPELLREARCHTPDKPWHALRHTFAAHAVMAGVSLYTVKELLGHASIEMTQRYAHLAPDYLGREVARLNFAAPGEGKVLPLSAARHNV